MKVGILTLRDREKTDGASIRVWSLAEEVAKLGVEVHVLSPTEVNKKLQENLFVHCLAPYPSLVKYNNLRRLTNFLSRPYSLYTKKRGKKEFPVHRGYLEMKIEKKVLAYVNKLNLQILQCEDVSYASVLSIMKQNNNISIPTIWDVHGAPFEEACHSRAIKEAGLVNLYKKWIEEIFMNLDYFFVVSGSLKHHLMERYGISKDRIFVIPNASSPTHKKRDLKSNPHKIVYAGCLSWWENVPLFIESIPSIFRGFPDAEIMIIGKGENEKDIREKVTSLPIELRSRVKFLGPKSRNDALELMSDCDVGVVPSTTDIVRKVASPVKFFDYISLGLAVVSVKVGDWASLIEQEGLGVVTRNDPKSFAEGVVHLLKNPQRLNKCSIRSRELCFRRYNWQNMAREVLKSYHEIIAQR